MEDLKTRGDVTVPRSDNGIVTADKSAAGLSAHETFERKVRAMGLCEQYQARKQKECQLSIETDDTQMKSILDKSTPLTYAEWLSTSALYQYWSRSSCHLSVLRQFDMGLWEDEPTGSPISTMHFNGSYLFCWHDVVVLRKYGQVTTQEEWDALVEGRYQTEWRKYLDRCHTQRDASAQSS